MGFHTVEDGPWPEGVTVAAYLTSALVGGQPFGPPESTGVASADGVVAFGGLTEGLSYTAFGHGGSQEFEAMIQEDRIQALEAAAAVLGAAAHKTPISVLDAPFNAVGDGVTDDSVAIQAAIEAAVAAGRRLYFPEGVYMAVGLVWRSGLKMKGDGRNVTILRQPANTLASIISGGTPDSTYLPVLDVTVEGITFDGDRVNKSVAGGGSLVHFYQASRTRFLGCQFINATGYGFGAQGNPEDATQAKRGPQYDLLFENCEFLYNGYNADGSSNSADGIDLKSGVRALFLNCHAEGNSDKGFNPRGRFVKFVGCSADNNVGAGFGASVIGRLLTTTTITADMTATQTTIPCAATSHLPPRGSVVIDSERIYYDAISGLTLTGCIRSFGAAAAATHSTGATVTYDDSDSYMTFAGCSAEGNGSSGFSVSTGEDSDNYVTFTGCHANRNFSSGFSVTVPGSTGLNRVVLTGCFANENTQHGVSIDNADVLHVLGGVYKSNITDGIRLNNQVGGIVRAEFIDNGGSGVRTTGTCSGIDIGGSRLSGNVAPAVAGTGYKATGHVDGALGTVTAAAALTLPAQRPVVQVNGNTSITSITATWDGDVVYLRFTGTPTLTKGSNLKLAADFVATADDVIGLTCNGTNWYALGPGSANS